MRIRRRAATENVGFNMTPMIDIVFQLITFFMLATDMSQRELEPVVPPEASQADVEEGGIPDRIFINIYHDRSYPCADYDPEAKREAVPVCRVPDHWKISVRGELMDMQALDKFLEFEALQKTDPKDPGVSLRTVQIRADRSAPYEEVQRVMTACARVGIAQIEFGATIPAQR